jgi:DNA-binding NarL/FixJ family response regulator
MLYGRHAECAVIDRLLADVASSRSGVLVLRGEAGVGKSALLTYGQERAAPTMRVLRGLGVQSESELPFAALHQILHSVLNYVGRLPAPQAAALRRAFGMAAGRGDDCFLVAVGVLSLLAEVAEAGPLLCVVDDAQWLDQASADALTFTARRLEAEGVVLLFAASDSDVRRFQAPGLPELRLGGLDDEAARVLLTEQSPSRLSPSVRDRLVASASGNPLALLELLAELSAEQLAGRQPLPNPLPVSAGVERAFLERVRRLPEATQQVLLLAAAEDTGDLAIVFRAARRLGTDTRAIEAAETAGLVRLSEIGLEFRHPLVRSAVYRGATFNQRRDAHLALAAVLPGERHADRRAWHRAVGTVGSDAAAADQLERTAEQARRRSGYAVAARALERSAQLSPTDGPRARRLVAAAAAAWLAGRPDRALALLDQVGSNAMMLHQQADINRLRGVIELRCGAPTVAFKALVAGAVEIAPVDSHKALEMLVEASQAASYLGDMALAVEAGENAAGLPSSQDPADHFMVRLLVGIGSMLEGDSRRGVPLLREAVALAAVLEDPRLIVWAGTAARYLGGDAAAHGFYARAVEQARADGEVSTLPHVLEYLADAEVWAGHYTAAAASASEGLRLARETGQENSACRHLGILALIAAIQGREEACGSHATEALAHAIPRGLRLHAASASWALALLDLGLGRPAEALPRLEALTATSSGIKHPVIALLATPDLVEAAIRVGRTETVQATLAGFERWAEHATPAWALALAPRCRGLISAGAVADHHFTQALRLHAKSGRPFDRARTDLLYGEALRRARRRSEARIHLRAALETFEHLGAIPWAERARAELRASGETTRPRDLSSMYQLTPQELQIVHFVGEGATNREVAAKLYLSPRTIDYHLRSIFAKLDISSRAELIRHHLGERTPLAR